MNTDFTELNIFKIIIQFKQSLLLEIKMSIHLSKNDLNPDVIIEKCEKSVTNIGDQMDKEGTVKVEK